MDKIAIISDIHSNLEALNTVLEDIKKRKINRIFCLGDIIAKGTHTRECIDLVRKNCEVIIKGNCDEFFANDFDVIGRSERAIWNKSKLTDEDTKFLRGLPFCHEFYMSGRLVRLLHAHPESLNKLAGSVDKLERLYELLLPSKNTVSNEKADVLIYGHIHTPYMQRIYNRMIVNTGSVGNSVEVFRNEEKDGNILNTTVANYLILSGNYDSRDFNEPISYEIVSLPYDIDKELAANTDNVEFESYKEEMKNDRYRNLDKVYSSFITRGIDKDKM